MEMIRQTFESDDNIRHFFNLGVEDIEIMVNLLEWGKANPMKVITHLDFGSSLEKATVSETPDVLIGHFLTELALCRKRGGELNPMLMLAQEALFRCLPQSEIFLSFLSKDKQQLQGRFHVGNMLPRNAQAFMVSMDNIESAIVRCLKTQAAVGWQRGESGLGLPFSPFGQRPFHFVYMAPIVAQKQSIGLCFVGRSNDNAFNERECVWIDQIVEQVAAAFAITQRS